jgi:hypothetical protein
MALKYKATLYETPEITDFLYVSQIKQEEMSRPKPIDSTLLDKRCYTTAEKFFFNKQGWRRAETLHIEIEEQPRIIQA